MEEDLLSFEELNGISAGVSGPSKRRDEGVYEVSASASTWSYRAPNTPSGSAVFPRILIALRGRKNAKSTSTARRSAPVALADRCDDVWGRTGGPESARGAARSAAALQALP
ncbi:hypothetical protein FB107DRAFT_280020 [Schizophyllum commune]